MRFFSEEPIAMPQKPIPRVELQSIFIRDHQRRLRLVIELLEEEIRQRSAPPQSTDAMPGQEPARAFTTLTIQVGGQDK
jgi:hypothetical protein